MRLSGILPASVRILFLAKILCQKIVFGITLGILKPTSGTPLPRMAENSKQPDLVSSRERDRDQESQSRSIFSAKETSFLKMIL